MKDNILIPTKEELRAELCKRSFFFFLKEFWDVVIPETPKIGWHIKYLCDELQYLNSFVVNRHPKPYDLIINISPGSTKSTIVSQMYNAWVWTIDPSQRFISSSYSHSLSLSQSTKTRDILLSDKYLDYFPYVSLKADQSGKSDFWNTKGGQRFTTSTNGTVTGVHAHQIIVDDPMNTRQAVSDVERETANDFVLSTLASRKVDKQITPIILIMQRLHVDDTTGEMLKKYKNIKHINLPAEETDEIKPIELRKYYIDGLMDPERLNRDVLEEAKRALGAYSYAGQFMQRPAPLDGAIWKKWLIPIHSNDIPVRLDNIGTDWDLAYTREQKNSASAYVTSGMKNGNMYITDLGFKHLEFPELIKWMENKQQPHYIENKASGKSAKQTLKSFGIAATEVKCEGDKVARARTASPFAESGYIYIDRDLIDTLYNDREQGILMFPNNSKDDLNDAFVQAIMRHFITKSTKVRRSSVY